MTDQPQKPFFQRLRGHVRSTLIVGVLILIPVAITYVLVRWAFDTVDGLLRPAIESLVGWSIPGFGLVALALAAYLLGLLWTKRLGRRAIRASQEFMLQIPVVGAVYGPARKLIESFTGDSAAGFKRVVIVEYPREGAWMIGFLTGITSFDSGETVGVIYLPTAPTPNSGWVAMVPVENIYDTAMTVPEAMSMVLSGGISSPLGIDLKPMDPQEADEFLEQGGMAAVTERKEEEG